MVGIKIIRHRSNPKALMSNTPLLFVCFDQEIEVKLPLTVSSSSSFSSSSDYHIFPIFLNPFLFIVAHNKSSSLSSFTLTFPNCPLPSPHFIESLHIVKTNLWISKRKGKELQTTSLGTNFFITKSARALQAAPRSREKLEQTSQAESRWRLMQAHKSCH